MTVQTDILKKADLESKLPQGVRKLHDIFVSNPIYLNLIKRNSIACAITQLCNDREFFGLARLRYSDQDALSLVAYAVKTFREQYL